MHSSGKQLVQWPVVEIEKLRANPVNLAPQVLKGGQLLQINGVTATQVDFTYYSINIIRVAMWFYSNITLFTRSFFQSSGTCIIFQYLIVLIILCNFSLSDVINSVTS